MELVETSPRTPAHDPFLEFMTRDNDSHPVRRFFPNIDLAFISYLKVLDGQNRLNKLVQERKVSGTMRLYHVVPLHDLHQLSPWNNDLAGPSLLKELAEFEVPSTTEAPDNLTFRETIECTTRHRVLLGYTFLAGSTRDSLCHHVTLCKKVVGRTALPPVKTMQPIFARGNSFFISVYRGEEKEDYVLSFVQFKTLSSGVAWINFAETSDTNSENIAIFRPDLPFFNRKVRFRGMGLRLLLLKLVQLHQCYHGNKPTLYVNVDRIDAESFLQFGFTVVDKEEERLVKEEAYSDNGVYDHTKKDFFLCIKDIVNPTKLKNSHMWNPRPCNEGEHDAASKAAIAEKVPEPLAAGLKTAPTEAPKPAQSASGLNAAGKESEEPSIPGGIRETANTSAGPKKAPDNDSALAATDDTGFKGSKVHSEWKGHVVSLPLVTQSPKASLALKLSISTVVKPGTLEFWKASIGELVLDTRLFFIEQEKNVECLGVLVPNHTKRKHLMESCKILHPS
jgi:hypothetical protein